MFWTCRDVDLGCAVMQWNNHLLTPKQTSNFVPKVFSRETNALLTADVLYIQYFVYLLIICLITVYLNGWCYLRLKCI